MTEIGPTPTFTKLGSRISLHTPSEHAAGQLVIICTWLGAARKHIAKYTDTYRNIAPKSKILLIESAVPILVSSYLVQRRAIRPAVQEVQAILEECGYTKNQNAATLPKILLHTFSDGGTNSATQMLIVLGERLGVPLPLIGIICDSGPAKGDYWKSYNAMVLSLPKGFARTIGPVVVHIILVLLFASIAAGRYDRPADLIRRTLLDGKLVGAPEAQDKRICYIFSKADRLVDWRDVIDHAEAARAKGWETEEVIFTHTAHCNHFATHEAEYSEKMQRLWDGKKVGNELRSRL